jgi:hypothetical protein
MPPETQDLVIMACSAPKRPEASPALELYQGVMYRTFRANVRPDARPHVAILSARHGVIAGDSVIEPYDHRLTPDLVDSMVANPRGYLQYSKPVGAKNVLLAGGKDYRRVMRAAMPELIARGCVAPDATVTETSGGIGYQRQQLRKFLEGATVSPTLLLPAIQEPAKLPAHVARAAGLATSTTPYLPTSGRDLVIITGSEAMLPHYAAVLDLYQGQMFSTFRAHVRPTAHPHVVVLSARQGFVSATELLTPDNEPKLTAGRIALMMKDLDSYLRGCSDINLRAVRNILLAGGKEHRPLMRAAVARLTERGRFGATPRVTETSGLIGYQRQQLGTFLRRLYPYGNVTGTLPNGQPQFHSLDGIAVGQLVSFASENSEREFATVEDIFMSPLGPSARVRRLAVANRDLAGQLVFLDRLHPEAPEPQAPTGPTGRQGLGGYQALHGAMRKRPAQREVVGYHPNGTPLYRSMGGFTVDREVSVVYQAGGIQPPRPAHIEQLFNGPSGPTACVRMLDATNPTAAHRWVGLRDLQPAVVGPHLPAGLIGRRRA